MSDTLVSATSRILTPELVGKMASASGLDRGTTQSAVSAFVPAVLSSLSDLAAKPGGARQIADAIAEQPAGTLSNLAATLSGAQAADKGSGLLSSLLGGGVHNTLVSTLSRFVGIGEGSTRTLMGLLTPVILGVLGREQRSQGLEASGLARMLIGQRDQISAAMPGGLSDLLSSRVRMQEGEASRTETRPYETPSYSRSTSYRDAPRMVEPREREREPSLASSGPSWPYWLLPLLALGGLLWYLLPGVQQTDRTTAEKTTTPGQQTDTRTPGQAAPGAPTRPTYLTKALPEWMPVGAYQNRDIYNRSGEKIGTIKDLLVGPDGRIHAAVVGVGSFLGIGEKDIAIPLTALQMERRDDGTRFSVDIAKDTLQTAPAFDYGDRIKLRQ